MYSPHENQINKATWISNKKYIKEKLKLIQMVEK
jgi:hypothetical protein